MPVDLASYLASRYLTTDSKPNKKRKRKHNSNPGGDGLLITDDDDSGWSSKERGTGDDGDDGDIVMGGSEGPGGFGSGATVAGTSAEFRKAKKSNWTSLGGDGKHNSSNDTIGGDDADAIISAAAADAAAARDAEDEAPVVAADGTGAASKVAASPALMSDGTHAGLQSAASVTAQLERRRREEREQYEREREEKRERRRQKRLQRQEEGSGGGGDGGDDHLDRSEGEEEVVYRDATGRRVDVALRRQEIRQAELEAEKKERAAKDALKGDVQREQARQRRDQLADAALMPLARGADDEEMNRELKDQARWNDPMAAFLEEKKQTAGTSSKNSGKGAMSSQAKSKSSRPTYRGPAAPNRYGIRPGYRWDGVDRSIGFEAERFKAINRRERNRDLEYQWQTDV